MCFKNSSRLVVILVVIVQFTFYARKQLLLLARLSHRNSVRLSVCLSVCLSHGWISQKRSKIWLQFSPTATRKT